MMIITACDQALATRIRLFENDINNIDGINHTGLVKINATLNSIENENDEKTELNKNIMLSGLVSVPTKYKLSIYETHVRSSFLEKERVVNLRGQTLRSAVIFGISSIDTNKKRLKEGEGLSLILSSKLEVPIEGEEQNLVIFSQSPSYNNKYILYDENDDVLINLNGFLLELSIGEELKNTPDLSRWAVERFITIKGKFQKE